MLTNNVSKKKKKKTEERNQTTEIAYNLILGMQFAQHIQTDLISSNKQVKEATNVEATICLHLCKVSQCLLTCNAELHRRCVRKSSNFRFVIGANQYTWLDS